jgi:RHS repeat-associated protein
VAALSVRTIRTSIFLASALVGLFAFVPRDLVAQDCVICDFIQVKPDGQTGPTALANTSGYSALFTVLNPGNNTHTYDITCTGTAPVTCTGTSVSSVTLNPGDSALVFAFYSVGAAGTGKIWLYATDVASDSGWYNIPVSASVPSVTLVAPVLSEVVTGLARANHGLIEWEVDSTRRLGVGDSALLEVTACNTSVGCQTMQRLVVLPNDNKPVLGFTGVPLEALGRQFSSPFGPGFSVAGGEVETGIGIPAYFSMGSARSAGLVYSTRQSYPRALVPVDLEVTWPAGTPDQIKLTLLDAGVKVDSLVLTSPTCATGAVRTCRAVLQGEFSASTPTRKWLTVEARVTSGASTQVSRDSVEVVVVDRRGTIYGSGWWPSGVLKLVAAGSDRLLIGPTGTAAVYRGNGDSLYLSPPGDFAALVKTGSGWELRPRGSTAKLVFDSNGRLYKALDQNGNRDSIAYNGASDQVTAFVDPVGQTISLGYDGSGKISTFTDAGSRQSRVSVDGNNQLTYDSISSPPSRPYTTRFTYQSYTNSSTVVLTKRIGVILDTTIVTYDSTFRRRPASVSLPAVDTGGASVRPVITYTAYERQGFGALRSLDSVYVEMKDPRTNWTRSLLNRWGEARKTWDALGTLGRTEYTAEGLVRWSEGKVADSSRVYHTYDALSRLARSYIIRTSGDTLRVDSLVYDSNHRVIKSIDARGKVSQIAYDANGNVTSTITPHNDTTRIWYRTDGLPDSTRAPGDTTSTRFSYESTWKNRFRVVSVSGETVDSTVYDHLGRDSISMSKTRVQVGTGSTQWQWRRRLPFYTVANQVDSTRIERTDNCADPCTTPPSWPLVSDTVKTQRVGYRFDRAGRDSLRLNDRGKAVLYLYDRLGRVVSRHPWTDSSAVRDSFVYDIAGNVKKTITRRGDTLTTNYDSRNRDTLSVLPGVGTLRKLFAGPGDQLTRLWYDSPVDSIGGVNQELRWGFDQVGRLKADTGYAGSLAQATTHAYDTFERPSSTGDRIGTWTTRYETDRGMADTVLTPLGDTVTYAFDVKGRGVGPTIRGTGSGVGLDRAPGWGAAGSLDSLVNKVPGGSGYTVGRWTRFDAPNDDHPPLINAWRDQPGSGAAADTLLDSLRHDGWERLTSVYRCSTKRAFCIQMETFTYDRTGNLNSGGGEVYNVVTDRLTATSTCSYKYDRAGNDTLTTCGANSWRYQYDALNQLRSVRYNGALIARYAYDVLGRRIAKRVYSASTGGTVAYTRFVYHGGAVAYETDSAGTTVTLKYTWGPGADNLLAIDDGTNHYYVVQDRLHSVRGLVKRDGTWIRSLRYFSYGGLESDTTSGSAPSWELRYRWTGRELDSETGLYFFRARYYDPGVRRFVQEDPIGYGGGANVYAYGNGGPLEGRDPGGTEYAPEYHYVARPNCWSLDCSGGAGMGDIFGFDWGGGDGDWMVQVDLQRAYDDLAWTDYAAYQKNYNTSLAQWSRYATSANLSNYGRDGRALSEKEFGEAKASILAMLANLEADGSRLPLDGAEAVENAATLLAGGHFGYSQAMQTGPKDVAHSSLRYTRSNGVVFAGMTFLGDGYLREDVYGRAVTLVHETYHWMYPGEEDDAAIEARAQSVVRVLLPL